MKQEVFLPKTMGVFFKDDDSYGNPKRVSSGPSELEAEGRLDLQGWRLTRYLSVLREDIIIDKNG